MAAHDAVERVPNFRGMRSLVRTWTEELGLTVPKQEKIAEQLQRDLEAIEDDNRARIASERATDGPGQDPRLDG